MSDLDTERLLTEALVEFERVTMPHIKPAGTAAAHRRVNQRKRRRFGFFAASATALLLPGLAVGALAVGHRESIPPPPPIQVTTTPSTDPIPTRDKDGGLPGTHIQVVSPSGETIFGCIGPQVTLGENAELRHITMIDVDHDGIPEYVGEIQCGDFTSTAKEGDSGPSLLAVFKKQQNGIALMGRIAADDVEVRGGPNGEVLVLTTLRNSGMDTSGYSNDIWLWQGFRWNGLHFVHSSGPADFTMHPNNKLKITASYVQTGGMVTIAAHNIGSSTAKGVQVLFSRAQLIPSGDGDWTRCVGQDKRGETTSGVPGPQCDLGDIAPGQTVTLHLAVTPGDDQPADTKELVEIFEGQQYVGRTYYSIKIG